MVEENMVYGKYNRILSSLKEENPVTCETEINVEDMMLSEISQSRKDRYCMIHFYGVCKVVGSWRQKARW